MKNNRFWALACLALAATQIIGCGPGASVDSKPADRANAKLSPAHQALINQRKKQDGG